MPTKYRVPREDGGFDETLVMPESGNFQTIEFDIEETLQQKQDKAVLIDFHYTKLIDDVIGVHYQKWWRKAQAGETYITPQEKLDEADRLAKECNEKIRALGITDYTYRKTTRGL